MKDAIKVIKKQMLLNTRLLEMFDTLHEALKHDTSGRDVSGTVQRMEPMLSELSKLEQEQRDFLSKRQQENMQDFLQAQPASVERDVAMRLLQQVGEMQQRLRDASAEGQLLLARSKEFVDFHIHVISEARAGATYGASESAGDGERRLRLFDANV